MLARSVDSDYQRYVLSLEILRNAEALMFFAIGAMFVAAPMTRCNSSAGVLDHIKGRAGNTGTQESLTSPGEQRLIRMAGTRTIQMDRVCITTLLYDKNKVIPHGI